MNTFNLVKEIQLACGQTYLAKTHDGKMIEIGDVFMEVEKGKGTRPYKFSDCSNPSDLEKRVITVCTMVGCNCTCTFCASRDSFSRNLTAEEIVEQVDFCLEHGLMQENPRDADPNNTKEFRVLYTRMGEPLLNLDNVIKSMEMLIERYPHIVIGLSSCGYPKALDILLERPDLLKHIDFQFSMHSTNDSERTKLFGRKVMSINEMAEYAKKFGNKLHNDVCLNTILFSGFEYDFKKIREIFGDTEIWIRLSPWNAVESVTGLDGILIEDDVYMKKATSSAELKAIIKNLDESGIPYSYAPAIDEEIKHHVACGQALEAFKKNTKAD